VQNAALLLVLAALVAPRLGAQSRTVHGRIVDAATGVAIVHARITAMDGPRTLAGTDSDDRGEYSLRLPAAARTLQVAKARYALTALPIPAGDAMPDVRVHLGAVLTGRILDEAGAPGVIVGLIRAWPLNNEGNAATDSPYWTMADERGEFRLGGLAEGRYVVSVPMPSRATTSAPIVVHWGEEIDVPDIRVAATPCAGRPPTPSPVTARAFVVQGRVLSPANIPLACARVRLIAGNANAGSFTTFTDARGAFAFRAIPADVFTVEAWRAGFAAATLGPIAAPADGARQRPATFDAIALRLAPAAVIAGTLSDERGEPLQGASIVAQELRVVDGRRTAGLAGLPQTTDDQGHYRLFGLSPGRYLIEVRPQGPAPAAADPFAAPLPVYYPGTADISLATPVDVGAGLVRDGVDFQRVRISGHTVVGSVVTAAGTPLAEGNAYLGLSARSGAILSSPIQATIADGRFEFRNVPPGDYAVQIVHNTGRVTEVGREFVTVGDRPPAPVVVRAIEGRDVSGRVVVEGEASLPPRLRVLLVPATPDEGRLITELPGNLLGTRWRSTTVVGTRRFVLAEAPDNYFLKSVRIGGIETAETPFDFGFRTEPISDVEIVVSALGATVMGTLRETAGAADYTAVIFSTAPSDWTAASPRVRMVRSGPDGRFSVHGLPPGTYYVVAIPPQPDAPARGAWQGVTLERLTGNAARVTLDEGTSREVSLELSKP
jgi:hypothetical protein